MATLEAISITSVDGITSSDDKSQALIKCKSIDGEELWIAFPVPQLLNLIELFSVEYTKIENRHRHQSGNVAMFPIQYWEIGKLNDGTFLLSLQMMSGGILSFQLNQHHISGIQQTLELLLGIKLSNPLNIDNVLN
jgi:hypothetical protein